MGAHETQGRRWCRRRAGESESGRAGEWWHAWGSRTDGNGAIRGSTTAGATLVKGETRRRDEELEEGAGL